MADEAEDERYMREAIALALTNRGATGSNPSVGCLIVRTDAEKGGEIVGTGVTAPGGRPHAETQALALAGSAARGATAYVSLEPCSHYGRTPPCALALIEAGISRVVVSVIDPDARVSGRGLALLRDAGITVVTGVLEQEGERALEGYLMRKRSNRPHVTLKLAVSTDGMIGIKGQGQVRITGAEARRYVHHLRAQTDAILIGIRTAIADDPDLTCRIPGLEDRSPLRVVIDPRLDLPPGSRLAQTARTVPVLVVADPVGMDRLSELGNVYPPLSLRDISPSRGEIDQAIGTPSARQFAKSDERAAPAISPLEGEMSDGTEGGEAATTAMAERRERLEALGVNILVRDRATPGALLQSLAARGISSLLVEGGAKTARTFLDAGLVDRILLFTGDVILGRTGIAAPFERDNMPAGFVHRGFEQMNGDRPGTHGRLDIYDHEGTR